MQTADAQRERAIRSQTHVRWPWERHPGWSALAERHPEGVPKMPPPTRSRAEIRALIVGRSG